MVMKGSLAPCKVINKPFLVNLLDLKKVCQNHLHFSIRFLVEKGNFLNTSIGQ